MKKRIAIICPIGKTGNVVTMTINRFLIEQLNFINLLNSGQQLENEIVVIVPHTDVSRYSYYNADDNQGRDFHCQIIISLEEDDEAIGLLQNQWSKGCWDVSKKVWSGTGYRWHPKIAGLEHPLYNQAQPTIIENIACYLIPIHPKKNNRVFTSQILPDIYDESSNDQFQDFIYGLCAVLNRQGYDIHISLAGGRKTMSAYQMTSATLFPVKAKLSHVLEPTIEKLNKFIKDNDLNISNKESELERIKAAYQPYPDLYESVTVKHIDLSEVAVSIGNFLGFSDKIQRKITNGDKGPDLSLTPLQEIFLNADNRRRIYKIGSIYRNELGRIDRFVAAKIHQGIATGMLHSFLRHEVTPTVFDKIRLDLEEIKYIATEENIEDIEDVVSQVTEQFELFKNTLSAIQTASALELDALKDEVRREAKPVGLAEVVDIAQKMNEVKDRLRTSGIRLCDLYSHIPIRMTCLLNVLALAFNNIMRNFMTVVNELENKAEEYTMTIEADVSDGKLALRFKDDGPGFDRQKWPDLERLFDWGAMKHNQQDEEQNGEVSFAKPDDKHQGLGLPMSRKIAQAHGGNLYAKDNEPHGAIFEFTLPLSGGKMNEG